MVAYTNYRRDPRVRRDAEALVGEGHEVVFLASRQPGGPVCEMIAGVSVVGLRGLQNRRTSIAVYMLDYVLFFLQVIGYLARHPLAVRLIYVNNMPDFLVFATWLPRMLGPSATTYTISC